MRLACKLSGKNPFATATPVQARKINISPDPLSGGMRSTRRREGGCAELVTEWQHRNLVYQGLVKKYWLNN